MSINKFCNDVGWLLDLASLPLCRHVDIPKAFLNVIVDLAYKCFEGVKAASGAAAASSGEAAVAALEADCFPRSRLVTLGRSSLGGCCV